MERRFALQVRPEPGVPDVIEACALLKQGLRAHGLRCVSIEEINMAKRADRHSDRGGDRRRLAAAGNRRRHRRGAPGDRGGAIPPATSIGRLTDIELGWLVAAGLFAWINTRAEQATAEGWDTEQTLRTTALDPEPWDAGAVAYVLPEIAKH